MLDRTGSNLPRETDCPAPFRVGEDQAFRSEEVQGGEQRLNLRIWVSEGWSTAFAALQNRKAGCSVSHILKRETLPLGCLELPIDRTLQGQRWCRL